MALYDKAFYIALFFILGIAAANFSLGVWPSLGLAALFAYFLVSSRLSSILIFTCIFFLGFFYLNFYNVINKDIIPYGEDTSYVGVIAQEPREMIASTEIVVDLANPHRGEVHVYLEPGREYMYGDQLAFTTTIDRSPTGRLNVASFPGKIAIKARGQGSYIKGVLIQLKASLVDNLRAVLSPQHAALAAGVLLGERAEFSEEFEEAMRNSGTTHIVALSGYNIAILAVVLSAMFSYIWDRRIAFYLSLIVIPGFVVMTGAEPSVVRAGIMGLILLLAEHQSRLYSFRNAITITALVMLLIDPTILISDVGFQLSFAALLGIVYLYPFLEEKLKITDEGFLAWKKNALQTASAQIAVLPIVLGTFGFFSPAALISNVLILEAIPITMLFSFGTAILGFLSYHLSLVVGWVTSIFLAYEVFIINFFGLSFT